MFVKAIQYKDVRTGDVVGRRDGERLQVLKVDESFGNVPGYPENIEILKVLVKGHPDYFVFAPVNAFIGLVHRPPTEGKTEKEMLRAIFGAFSRVSPFWLSARTEEDMKTADRVLGEAAPSVREAIEAWELGRPPAQASKSVAGNQKCCYGD